MYRRLILVLAIFALTSGSAFAQGANVPPQDHTRGEIVNLTSSSLTLEMKTGQHVSYAIEGDTVKPANLQLGDVVSVRPLPGQGEDDMQKALEIAVVTESDRQAATSTRYADRERQTETTDAESTTTVESDSMPTTDTTMDDEDTMATTGTTATGTQMAQNTPRQDTTYRDRNAEQMDTTEVDTQDSDYQSDSATLPQTASPLAKFALIGLLALGGLVGLRRLFS